MLWPIDFYWHLSIHLCHTWEIILFKVMDKINLTSLFQMRCVMSFTRKIQSHDFAGLELGPKVWLRRNFEQHLTWERIIGFLWIDCAFQAYRMTFIYRTPISTLKAFYLNNHILAYTFWVYKCTNSFISPPWTHYEISI